MIIYCIREISPLKVHISKLIFTEKEKIDNLNANYYPKLKNEKTMRHKEVSDMKLIQNKKIKNPPKKMEKRRSRRESNENIKNTENNE